MEALKPEQVVIDKTKLMEVKEREALYVLKTDLSKWLSYVMRESICPDTFMSHLDNGITLCRLARKVQRIALEINRKQDLDKSKPKEGTHPHGSEDKTVLVVRGRCIPMREIVCNHLAKKQSFQARDNAANFISWARELGLEDSVLFESEGLVLHRDERRVILTLMGVARVGGDLGMATPTLVEMEKEIDNLETGREAIKISRGDEEILGILHQCTCTKRQMKAVNHGCGKFHITTPSGRNMMMYIRILHEQIMVRVGGGWDTLDHFLLRYDPCRVGGANATELLASNDTKKKSSSLKLKRSPLRVRQISPTPHLATPTTISDKVTMRKCTSTPSLSSQKKKSD